MGLLPVVSPGLAQEANRGSLAGEAAAEAQASARIPSRYNLGLWSGGVSISAALRQQYISNVYLTEHNVRDDFILTPDLNLAAFFPIGRLNTLSLNLDTAYYQYFKNDNLNTGVPLINPDSDLVFNIYTGDFVIKLSERFSYQETPFYESGGQFYNVYNTGLFRRFDNLVGPSVTWDLHHLVIHGSYAHENFWANEAAYDYIDRASEFFTADALAAVHPKLSVGLEANGSLHAYDNTPWNDNWRAGAGPALRLSPTEFIKLRFGAGYQTIQFDPKWASVIGELSEDTYYAYAGLDQVINRFFSHAFSVSHDNEPGINGANLEGTHLRYTLNWLPRERVTVSSYLSFSWYHESLGNVNGIRYDETFTYFLPGMNIGYQFLQNLRGDLSWSFALKDSDLAGASYDQNRVAATITYQF